VCSFSRLGQLTFVEVAPARRDGCLISASQDLLAPGTSIRDLLPSRREHPWLQYFPRKHRQGRHLPILTRDNPRASLARLRIPPSTWRVSRQAHADRPEPARADSCRIDSNHHVGSADAQSAYPYVVSRIPPWKGPGRGAALAVVRYLCGFGDPSRAALTTQRPYGLTSLQYCPSRQPPAHRTPLLHGNATPRNVASLAVVGSPRSTCAPCVV
jgi:hypothetical protein